MSVIHGTAVIRGGQVIPTGPINLPDGTEIQLTTGAEDDAMEEREKDFPPDSPPAGVRFMTEDEQSDDPEAIRKWLEEWEDIPALPEPSPEEAAAAKAWQETFRAYNIEAVRRQFEEGIP